MNRPETKADKPADAQLQFVCIHCGHPVDSLYKQYSSSVLKIIECGNCAEIADKYIEFEPIVVVIDIVLLHRETYRHVLYNTHFRIRWKLAVVLVLLESYILCKDRQAQDPQNVHQFSTEQMFYMCFMLSLIDKLLLSLLLFALAQTVDFCPMAAAAAASPMWSRQRQLLANVVKSVTLGSVTKFFLLPAVIWHSNITEADVQLHERVVGAYYWMALVQIVSVLVNCSRWRAAVMVTLAMAAKALLVSELNRIIGLHLC